MLLYGSQATGEAGENSDIDLCIVAPQAIDQSKLWRQFVSHIKDSRHDVRIFELLPLYLKSAVIEQGVVVALQRRAGALRVPLFLPARLG